MKNLLVIKLLVVSFIMLLFSCSADEDNKPDLSKGTINFKFDIAGNFKSADNMVTEREPKSIYISLKDAEQGYVYNLHKIPLIKFGDEYITEQIELVPGSYTIEDFIVVDKEDSAMYIIPKSGSEFEALVSNPLPFGFEVTPKNTSSLILEVIPTNLGEPVEYGYAEFSFIVVDSVENDLVAYYAFNENANDLSGNGNHGVVNGASLTNDRNGNSKSAYEFDGVDDFIEVLEIGSIVPTREITVSIWVKSKIAKTQFQLMLCPDQNRFAISIDYMHNGVNSIFWDFGWEGDGGNAPGRLYDFNQEFDTNWHHYVFTSSVSQSVMRIYKDGDLLVEELDPKTLLNSLDRNLVIGSADDRFFYEGIIDEVRIYKRALTQSEIYEIYQLD